MVKLKKVTFIYAKVMHHEMFDYAKKYFLSILSEHSVFANFMSRFLHIL